MLFLSLARLDPNDGYKVAPLVRDHEIHSVTGRPVVMARKVNPAGNKGILCGPVH